MSHHPDNRLVVHPGNAGVELHAHGVHGRVDVNVKSAVGHQEVLPGKFLQWEGGPAVEGVVLGEDRIHFFIVQGRPVAEAVVLPAGKNHVGLPAFQQLVGLQRVIHHPEIHADIRADALVAVKQLRHPVHGDAGVGGHPDGLLLAGADHGDLPLQGAVGRQALLHDGHDPLACRGQPHAAAVTRQDGKADLPLQAVHHVGQARLGIAQLLRRAGEAAQLHRRGQRLQLFAVHVRPSSFPSQIVAYILSWDCCKCNHQI